MNAEGRREGKGREGKGREGKGREGRNQLMQHQMKIQTDTMLGQMNKRTQGLAEQLQLLLTMTMSLNCSPEQAWAE